MHTELTDDDQARLRAIGQAVHDQRTLATLITQYYGDADRAKRTPRELMYYHLGLLAGAVHLLTTPVEIVQ